MPKYYVNKLSFHIISKEEILPYIESNPDEDSKYAIALAWLTGMRIREVVDLTTGNFSVNEGLKFVTITYKSRKKGRLGSPSFAFSDPFIEDIILPYYRKALSERRERLLIRKTTRRYQQILQKLNTQLHGMDTQRFVTFHQMRHSRISYLVQYLKATMAEIKSFTGRATNPDEYIIAQDTEKFRGRF
jgi:integrase